jgi:transposase
LSSLVIDEVDDTGSIVRLHARTATPGGACPRCGGTSRRVHAWHARRLAVLPVAGRGVLIELQVRRLVCQDAQCPQRTFRQQVPALAARYARRTQRLTATVGRVAVTLAGRARTDRVHLEQLLATCPHLVVLTEHVRAFAGLLGERRGADLEGWMSAVEASDLPALHGFVRGLRKDLPAVTAGLSLPYSNGPIEGVNTKVKLLRRQMYGRAGFALLRRRILLS